MPKRADEVWVFTRVTIGDAARLKALLRREAEPQSMADFLRMLISDALIDQFDEQPLCELPPKRERKLR